MCTHNMYSTTSIHNTCVSIYNTLFCIHNMSITTGIPQHVTGDPQCVPTLCVPQHQSTIHVSVSTIHYSVSTICLPQQVFHNMLLVTHNVYPQHWGLYMLWRHDRVLWVTCCGQHCLCCGLHVIHNFKFVVHNITMLSTT